MQIPNEDDNSSDTVILFNLFGDNRSLRFYALTAVGAFFIFCHYEQATAKRGNFALTVIASFSKKNAAIS